MTADRFSRQAGTRCRYVAERSQLNSRYGVKLVQPCVSSPSHTSRLSSPRSLARLLRRGSFVRAGDLGRVDGPWDHADALGPGLVAAVDLIEQRGLLRRDVVQLRAVAREVV